MSKINQDILFDFDDILIQSAAESDIESRFKDITFSYSPLFTAPMDTVVNIDNYNLFLEQNINVCLPRNSENMNFYATEEEVFHSLSLAEFEDLYIKKKLDPLHKKICIDTANGHMKKMHETIRSFKESSIGDKAEIMAGNIGSPEGFLKLAESGCDIIRVGIGFGSGCLTSQQTGIGYPMASLVHECFVIKQEHNLKTKIVADGGMKNYSDIVKSIALGADYVMLGGMLNKTLESCAPTYMGNKNHGSWKEPGEVINQYDSKYAEMLKMGTKFYKKYRGMSTKEVQKEWGNKKIRTSEGITKLNEVEYTLAGWCENFDHYIRSAMSYTNSKTLDEFKGSNFNLISEKSFNRFNK